MLRPALIAGKPNAALNRYRRTWWRRRGVRLSPHFTVHEFNCHDGSVVPINSGAALVRLCRDYLEPMRAKFGACHVLSGYRHRVYNAGIGGARNSQHIYEETPDSVAADVRFARGNPREWAEFAYDLRRRLGKGGIGVYMRSGFVHVDNRPYRADWRG